MGVWRPGRSGGYRDPSTAVEVRLFGEPQSSLRMTKSLVLVRLLLLLLLLLLLRLLTSDVFLFFVIEPLAIGADLDFFFLTVAFHDRFVGH